MGAFAKIAFGWLLLAALVPAGCGAGSASGYDTGGHADGAVADTCGDAGAADCGGADAAGPECGAQAESGGCGGCSGNGVADGGMLCVGWALMSAWRRRTKNRAGEKGGRSATD